MVHGQVLIVDTNIELYDVSVGEWAKYGIKSHRVDTIELAYREICKQKYQLIVIVECKEMRADVLDSIKVIREFTDAPLVIASTDPIDPVYRVKGLDLGADEVWEMPQTIQEAVAKGNAAIRRYKQYNNNSSIHIQPSVHNHLIIDTEKRRVYVKGKLITLMRKEFEILKLLMLSPGKVFTYEQIFYNVWGDDHIDNSKNILWNHIVKLRSKIQIDDDLPEFIVTNHGIGYSFVS